MISWYDASQGVVEAANAAMDETSDSDRCREIWEPIANARAFVRNLRPWLAMPREKAQAVDPRG